MTAFHFITVVWGKKFTRNYLDLSLPTQLAPGNLPSFTDYPECIYKVYTTAEDAPLIRVDPRFIQAGRYVRTEIIEFAVIGKSLNFGSMIAVYRRVIQEINAAEVAMVGLGPDMLFSDGCFAALRHRREQGKRLILTASLRARLKTFPAALKNAVSPDQTGAVSLPPRLLMQLTFNHLHSISESLFWNSPNFSNNPTHICNWLRSTSPRILELHGFFIHPLLVDATNKNAIPTGTIDNDYVDIACPDKTTHYIVSDSDELACVELSDDDHLSKFDGTGSANIKTIAAWCVEKCTDTHRQFVQTPILLHEGPIPANLPKGEGESSEAISMILRRCVVALKIERWRETASHFFRWRGWLKEQHWSDTTLRKRNQSRGPHNSTYLLDACWPSDLVTVYGCVVGQSALKTKLQFGDHSPIEKILPSGDFNWTVLAPFSYGPMLQILTPASTAENYLLVVGLTTWRTTLHHLRHKYTEGRADPTWLEWVGLQPGHILDGPATFRVIPHWGVTDVILELESYEKHPNSARPAIRCLISAELSCVP